MVALTRIGKLTERMGLAFRGWKRIEGIPTSDFNEILATHVRSGWTKCYEYDGMDAWIDYGRVDLRKGSIRLRFEWTNWLEGEISGPRDVIRDLSQRTRGPTVSSE
jgi:hypothetical protein